MAIIHGQISPEPGVVYVLTEKHGKDGKTYWYMAKVGTDKQYSIHHRACGECGAEVLVCNCNSFFWKGGCKHIEMFNQIRAKVVAEG